MINYKEYINTELFGFNELPLNISTMCTSCKLNSKLNIPNIKELDLDINNILSIKMNDESVKTLLNLKKKKKSMIINEERKKPYTTMSIYDNDFVNQQTIEMRITNGQTINLDKEPKINMKLFINGSIQMSGCKSIQHINIVLNKLINRLNTYYLLDNIEELKIIDFKIDMINCNYKNKFKIDRYKLYNLLKKKKIRSSFEPCIRACVNIKYSLNNNIISIDIYEKGSIIITGCRSRKDIIDTYNFINDLLTNHKLDIILIDNIELMNKILSNYESNITLLSFGFS